MWQAVESGCEGGAGNGVPCARGKHAAALLGRHVYVLGGRGAGGSLPLRDFWRYSLAEGRWEQIPCTGEAPPALQEHTMTAHGAKLYVFGGEAGCISTEIPLWVYDTETQVWRKLAGQSAPVPRRRGGTRDPTASAGPRGRRGHSAHALRDCLLIYGGYKDMRGSTNELWAFHYESETWQQVRTGTTGSTGAAGPARHRHAAALHGARLYVHGGARDLHDQADLWHYDTISRVWTCVRTPSRSSPAARSGHAGLRAGAHLYIFGGEVGGHLTNELWRFHFATETWERVEAGVSWPCPRVDCRALLVGGAPPRTRSAPRLAPRAAPPAPNGGLLREISKLSSFHRRRAARCSYSVLAPAPDSTESLPRVARSLSAHALDPARPPSPRAADPAPPADLSRDPLSVPDFGRAAVPATRLVCLDSDDEHDEHEPRPTIAKSASVRFAGDSVTVTTEEEAGALSTSDYASSGRLSGFSNPHYLGPDVRRLGRAALTPDSGLDIELEDLSARRHAQHAQPPAEAPQQLHVLVVGGREPPHAARLHCPLAMWTYRLL